MKTKLETLETLHDYTLEDIVRCEIKIRVHDGKKDADTLEGFQKRGAMGFTDATKKDYVEEQEKERARLEGVLRTVDKLIEEEHGIRNKSQKES
ncbi:MAG: hypothetical protein WC530_09935 [Candidatus Omnitrophota bacterium]|nr:hypothetical protein [Patescibacteria group bacterium]